MTMKKYLIEKLNVLRQLFVSSNKPDMDLEKRVNEAKRIVRYTSHGDMIFVQNYNEVRQVLGYEDTLSMALFVRDFIARQAPTKKCIECLTQ